MTNVLLQFVIYYVRVNMFIISDSSIYKFYMGSELNPRIFGIDWKVFCELRPGLLGWVVIDISVIAQAWNIDNVSTPLLIAVAFHFIYVADALYYEVRSCKLSLQSST